MGVNRTLWELGMGDESRSDLRCFEAINHDAQFLRCVRSKCLKLRKFIRSEDFSRAGGFAEGRCRLGS